MPSESQVETIVLAGQLNAFAEAQRLREEIAVKDARIKELELEIKRLSSEPEEPVAPMLLCLCCDAEMAPATMSDAGVWEWEDGKKAECSNCGWEGRVTADGNGQRASMEEFEEDEVPEEDEVEEEFI